MHRVFIIYTEKDLGIYNSLVVAGARSPRNYRAAFGRPLTRNFGLLRWMAGKCISQTQLRSCCVWQRGGGEPFECFHTLFLFFFVPLMLLYKKKVNGI